MKIRVAGVIAVLMAFAILPPLNANASIPPPDADDCYVVTTNIHRISTTSIGATGSLICSTSEVGLKVGLTISRAGKTVIGNGYCNMPLPAKCSINVVIPDIAGSQAYSFLVEGSWWGYPRTIKSLTGPYYF